jgi:predicted nuclease with TOPRIM domain
MDLSLHLISAFLKNLEPILSKNMCDTPECRCCAKGAEAALRAIKGFVDKMKLYDKTKADLEYRIKKLGELYKKLADERNTLVSKLKEKDKEIEEKNNDIESSSLIIGRLIKKYSELTNGIQHMDATLLETLTSSVTIFCQQFSNANTPFNDESIFS